MFFPSSPSSEYKNLSQTGISKFFFPRAHGNQAQLAQDTKIKLLHMLKNTERIIVVPKDGGAGT
jgi:hypothetical protein